jgi:hypothetical protein
MLARRGLPATFNWQDIGTSRWQLVIERYTIFSHLQKGGVGGGLWPGPLLRPHANSGLAEAFVKGAHVVCECIRRSEADQTDYRQRALLGRRRERPRRRPPSAAMNSRRRIDHPPGRFIGSLSRPRMH